MLAGILNDWKTSFRELETKRSSRSLEVIPDAEEEEDFDGVGLGDAEGGAGWLRGPEEAGLEAEEKGSTDGAPCELLPGAEVATATNFSPRLTLTAEAEGGKEGFPPTFGADTLGIGVLSRAGLKPSDPKENEAADGATGEAAGVGAGEA